MSMPIRVSKDTYDMAKVTAKAEMRSIPAQVEYWARVGRTALDNPDLPIEFIKELLISKNTDRQLAESFEKR